MQRCASTLRPPSVLDCLRKREQLQLAQRGAAVRHGVQEDIRDASSPAQVQRAVSGTISSTRRSVAPHHGGNQHHAGAGMRACEF
jgi:hypothetical protein